MLPSEYFVLPDPPSRKEQTQGNPPSVLEPIDQPQQTLSPGNITASYLLTNLHDPQVALLRRQANEGQIDGWGVSQTTHRATENESIQQGIALLTQRYANVAKPSIAEIEIYIRNNRVTLEQNDFAQDDFAFLDAYLNRAKNVDKDNELLQLCWLALGDENAPCHKCDLAQLQGNAMCTKRKQLFLKGLIQRLKADSICGHGTHNAIYEAMQCLHPDTKRIMDLAAIQDLITLTVQEALLDYLLVHSDLETQLTIIKTWLANSANGDSLFTRQDPGLEQKIVDKVCEKFRAKGYEEISDKALIKIKSYFYTTPLFLQEFENLETEFPNVIYQLQPRINSLEDHVKLFKRQSLKRKYNEYGTVLPKHLFNALIERLLIEKIDGYKPHMNRSVFEFVYEKLKNHEGLPELFLDKVITNDKEYYQIRICALLTKLHKMHDSRQSPEKIIETVSQLGTAEDIMWLFCRSYHKESNESFRESLENLILLLYDLGVKPEKCVRKNISATELLITAKPAAKPAILNIVSSTIQRKHQLRNVELNMQFAERFIVYSFCVAITFNILGLISLSVAPFILLAALCLPIVFLPELKRLFNLNYQNIFEAQINKSNQLINDRDNKYKEFFTSTRSTFEKIISPLFKIANIVNTIHTSYTSKVYGAQEYVSDILQPYFGVKHIMKGFFKIVSSPVRLFDSKSRLSSIPIQAVNGLSTMIRGLAEIVSTPFTYIVKIPFRIIFTSFEKIQYKQRRLLSLALDLQNEIADVTNNQVIDSHTPLLNGKNNSSKKICNQLFNHVARLHKEYKEFKVNDHATNSNFLKEEKKKWQAVKSTFFKHLIEKKTENQDCVKDTISDYCRLFTR